MSLWASLISPHLKPHIYLQQAEKPFPKLHSDTITESQDCLHIRGIHAPGDEAAEALWWSGLWMALLVLSASITSLVFVFFVLFCFNLPRKASPSFCSIFLHNMPSWSLIAFPASNHTTDFRASFWDQGSLTHVVAWCFAWIILHPNTSTCQKPFLSDALVVSAW